MQAVDVRSRIARLFVYPVKSCAAVEVREMPLTETGMDLDRAWMVVDAATGEWVSQRELPRMALVQVRMKVSEVILRAPGMLGLHLAVDAAEGPTRVRLWGAEMPAYDMGDVAAQWFSDFLGRKLRLVRFDPDHTRLSSTKWTGDIQAPNLFSDGFPLLVVGEGSMTELNTRLLAAGHAAVGVERFRPNIVLEGLDPGDEDRLDTIRIGEHGEIVLRPVKPCPRCPVPNIDPATAESNPAVTDALQTFCRNPTMDGAVTFGMNCVIVDGVDQMLRVGQPVEANWRF